MNLKKSITIAFLLVSIIIISVVVAQTPGSELWRALRAANEAYSAYNLARDVVESLEVTLEGLEAAEDAAQDVFSTWMTHYLNAEAVLEAKRQERDDAFDDYEAADNWVDATESHIAGLEADLAYARQRLSDVSSGSNSDSGSKADYWLQKISDLQTDLSIAYPELESAKKARNRSWNALKRHQRDIPFLEASKISAKKTLDKAAKQVEDAEKQVADKKKEIAAAKAEKQKKYEAYLELKRIYDELVASEEEDEK